MASTARPFGSGKGGERWGATALSSKKRRFIRSHGSAQFQSNWTSLALGNETDANNLASEWNLSFSVSVNSDRSSEGCAPSRALLGFYLVARWVFLMINAFDSIFDNCTLSSWVDNLPWAQRLGTWRHNRSEPFAKLPHVLVQSCNHAYLQLCQNPASLAPKDLIRCVQK